MIAEALRDKLKGEAEGLTEKAAALAALDSASREHEEYRLRLEAEKEIRLAALDVQRDVAEAQATVLSVGLEKADIDIVGGETMFFDRIVGSIGLGKSVDGFVQHSDVVQSLARPYLDGSASLTDDLAKLIGAVSTEDVKNLTLSAFLAQQLKAGGPDTDKLRELMTTAQRLGLAETSVATVVAAKQ